MPKPATKKPAANARNTGRTARDQEPEDDEEVEDVEVAPFDYNSFFAQAGLKFTEDDLRDLSAILPIYSFEDAAEEKWPPLFGLLCNRIRIEVNKLEKNPEQRWRWFYVVEAEIPTHALAGTGEDRETIDVEAGQYVLMPESGALKNLNELKMAAIDPDFVYRAVFRLTGRKIDLGKPGRNPMWEVEAKLIEEQNPTKRSGRYLLQNTARDDSAAAAAQLPSAQANGQPALPPGTVVNQQGQPARAIG